MRVKTRRGWMWDLRVPRQCLRRRIEIAVRFLEES
jgi:hypothetical protein